MTIEREARYELHGIILNVKNRSKKRKSHRAICNIKNTRTLQYINVIHEEFAPEICNLKYTEMTFGSACIFETHKGK